jgi:phosphoribosylaminoimidazole-succinocarboxamide synthase
MEQEPILKTDIKEYPLFVRGKVRDVYDLDDKLLIVASDRISAFDCVMPNGIPDKGKILTQMSLFWFNMMEEIVKNHLVATNTSDFPKNLQPYKEMLTDRAVIVKKANRIDVECVVRGYLEGSGWKDYQKDGAICGIRLPEGLKQCQELPEPIYTPAFKASSGHDENINFEKVTEMVGRETAEKLRDLTLKIFGKAHDYAKDRGIIIADTKFEFGLLEDEIILIDEILSPDSSRFWPVDTYEPGHAQFSFDKQFLREYLETLDWDKTPPAPELPDEIVKKTKEKYEEAFRRLVEEKK